MYLHSHKQNPDKLWPDGPQLAHMQTLLPTFPMQ